MKAKTKRRIKGSVTVLLVIILVPMMTLSAIIVDISRINMAKSMVSSSGDLAMNTALANYDTILKDVYGLFAMSQTEEDLSKSIQKYFETTLVSYGVVSESESKDYVKNLLGDFDKYISGTDDDISNFLDMDISNFTAKGVENGSLANTDILRTQIVEYMKYRAPINFGLSFLDSVKAFKTVQDQAKVVESEVKAQEKTQDVTEACKNAITAIREFDKLIDKMQGGDNDKTVKGLNNYSDGQVVKIQEKGTDNNYSNQINKYRENWGNDNYQQINKLNLIFLLTSPNKSDYYLSGKKFNDSTVERYVKNDATLDTNNSGINIKVDVSNDLKTAKSDLDSILKTLNGADKTTAYKYNGCYLSDEYLKGDKKSFKNEDSAINSFVNYEKFLLNKDNNKNIKYDDIKKIFEDLYKLEKIFENYNKLQKEEIDKLEGILSKKEGAKKSAGKNAGIYCGNINGYISALNTGIENVKSNKEHYKDNDSVNNILQDVTGFVYNSVSETQLIGDRNFIATINTGSYPKNIYTNAFNNLANYFKDNGNGNEKKVATAAKNFRNDTNYQKKDYNEFENYMNDKVEDFEKDALFCILDNLYYNEINIDGLHNQITLYLGIKSNYKTLYDEYKTADDNVNSAKSKLSTCENDKKSCISEFIDLDTYYQTDLKRYSQYIETSQNLINDKVTHINEQYKKIYDNLKELHKKVDDIAKKLQTVYDKIEEYEKELENWENQSNNYSGKNGDDSFNSQQKTDIKTAKTNYNKNNVLTLKKRAEDVRDDYKKLLDYMDNKDNLKYGSKKIKDIKNYKDVKNAVTQDVKNSLTAPVTVEVANQKLDSLYSKNKMPKAERPDLKFLDPILPLQFLRYLNENFPEQKELTEEEKTQKQDYEDAKNGTLTESKKTKDEDKKNDSGSNKYGYTYSGKNVPEKDLPSQGGGAGSVKTDQYNASKDGDKVKTSDGVKTEQYSASKDGDKVKASDSVSSQSSTLDTILNGIESVAEGALENTYILSYIFSNFSYNTLIQDALVEGEKISSENAENIEAVEKNSNLNKYVGKSKTLSNYTKNGNNNYLYGAEIEYLLFGDLDASKNVTYTKASIYAIRFVFNCIYAFTNTEIRNITMSAGMAVQAATMGIVPYQIVQVVLQLALAAAESAIDLEMMNNGLKVAVVKSADTWNLVPSNIGKTVASIASEVASKVSEKAIKDLSSGLQSLVDASAKELVDALDGLKTSITIATETKAKEIVDNMYSTIQSKIEEKLNELAFFEYNKEDGTISIPVTEKVEEVFATLSAEIKAEVESHFAGNEMAQTLFDKIDINFQIDTIVKTVKNRVLKEIGSDPTIQASNLISKMDSIKQNMLDAIDNSLTNISSFVDTTISETITSVSSDIQKGIDECAQDLTEEACEKIKGNVTESVNGFFDKNLQDKSTVGDKKVSLKKGGDADLNTKKASEKTSSSIASAIKFGYKEYLMLFVFLNLCVNDTTIMSRVADLIQLNIQNAGDQAEYKHKKGSDFKMSNAYAYVEVDAEVKLHMLFLNLDFFSNVIDSDKTKVEDQFSAVATIKYKNIYGY